MDINRFAILLVTCIVFFFKLLVTNRFAVLLTCIVFFKVLVINRFTVFFSAWLKNLEWEWSLVECLMLKCFECIFECLLSVWSFKFGLKHNLVFLLQSVHPFSSSIIICSLSVSPIFSFGKYQSLYFRSDLRYVSVLDGKRYDHLREGLAFFKYKNRETDSG